MKIIGIVGTRRRDGDCDYREVLMKFNELYEPGDRLVSGGCPEGADRFAEIIAKKKGLSIMIHYPRDCRGGTFVRNTLVAEDATHLIACVAPDRRGGTEDTITKSIKLNRPIYLVE
jgi:hypothetical protein